MNSDTGVATGNALGIDFTVAGASGAQIESKPGNQPGSGRAEITLADDLNIELEMIDGGNTIIFQMNGKNFGNLERGDQVAIGEDRKVAVNGTEKVHQESPPEE